jgi:predicted transcriptional regulator
MDEQLNLTGMTVDIIVAYVIKNAISASELPSLIGNIYKTLNGLTVSEDVKSSEVKEPAVSIKKSIGREFLICLEDGRQFKSLKRHLRTKYNMSPEDYRAKWNLPKDYPMVAPAYAETRSNLAKKMGLGQGGRAAKTRPARKAAQA